PHFFSLRLHRWWWRWRRRRRRRWWRGRRAARRRRRWRRRCRRRCQQRWCNRGEAGIRIGINATASRRIQPQYAAAGGELSAAESELTGAGGDNTATAVCVHISDRDTFDQLLNAGAVEIDCALSMKLRKEAD